MERDRTSDARLSRVEERAARLEERVDADRDAREEWRAEVARRLGELNNHSARLDAERDHFLSKEIYEARHSELAALIENRSRQLALENREQGKEFAAENRRLLEDLTRRITDHEREDTDNHKEHSNRIAGLQKWQDNMTGRFWALGAAVTILTVLLHFLFK